MTQRRCKRLKPKDSLKARINQFLAERCTWNIESFWWKDYNWPTWMWTLTSDGDLFCVQKEKKLNNIFCLISLFIYKRAFKRAQFLSHRFHQIRPCSDIFGPWLPCPCFVQPHSNQSVAMLTSSGALPELQLPLEPFDVLFFWQRTQILWI